MNKVEESKNEKFKTFSKSIYEKFVEIENVLNEKNIKNESQKIPSEKFGYYNLLLDDKDKVSASLKFSIDEDGRILICQIYSKKNIDVEKTKFWKIFGKTLKNELGSFFFKEKNHVVWTKTRIRRA